jgi:hypothetical protein
MKAADLFWMLKRRQKSLRAKTARLNARLARLRRRAGLCAFLALLAGVAFTGCAARTVTGRYDFDEPHPDWPALHREYVRQGREDYRHSLEGGAP